MQPSAETIGLLYAIAAVTGFVAAAVVWSHRARPGARPLALMLAATGVWAGCDTVELTLATVEGRRLISQVQYFGVVSAAPLFLHAAFGLAGRTTPLPARWVIAIWSIPVATLAVAWTSAWHSWLWTAIRVPSAGIGPGVYEYGTWFWVLALDHYILSAIGLVVLVQAMRRVRRPFRAPLMVVALAVALPWIGNIVYVFKLGPWPGFNWLGVSIIGSGLVFSWLALREGLFDMLPAHEAITELLAEAVVVVNDGGEVLMANPAAGAMLGLTTGGRAGEPMLRALAIAPAADRSTAPLEVQLPGDRRWLEVRRGGVPDRWGAEVAHLVVVRDISGRKRVEQEREALIADLSAALGRIRTLEGLLPICARCKKIRDDAGTWKPVESYFESRTSVEFTHGICPDCSRDFFATLGRTEGAG